MSYFDEETNMNESRGFSRRPVLQGMFASGTASLFAAAPPAAAAASKLRPIDVNSKEDQAFIFRKLGYSMDEKLGFWQLTATRYGLVGAELIPFWQMNLGRFFTVHDLPGGSYEVTQNGVAFYTDLQTGELLRTFKNPITKKTIEIQYAEPTPRRFAPPEAVKSTYELMGGTPPSGRNGTGTVGPAWIQGDHVWIQQDHLMVAPSTGPVNNRSRISDLTTYFGSLRDIADPSIAMPPAGHAFTDINDWPTWLEMGDHPGEYYSRGIGFKSFSFDQMPGLWKKLLLQHYPAIAKDPLHALHG